MGILSNGAKEVLAFNTSNEHPDVEGKGAGASLLIRICSYKLTKKLESNYILIMHDQRTQFSFQVKVTS